MLDNSGTVRVKLSSVLAKQQPPHSDHVALVIEQTTLTHALLDMHVCVCMCITEHRCKPLVTCVARSSMHYAWRSPTFLGFDRNLQDLLFPSILNSTVTKIQGYWTQHHSNQEPQKHMNTLINENSHCSSLVLAGKFTLSIPGQGDMVQHLEGTMD